MLPVFRKYLEISGLIGYILPGTLILALSAVQFLIDNYGLSEVQYVFELMSGDQEVTTILKQITGYSFKEFQANWKEFYAQ